MTMRNVGLVTLMVIISLGCFGQVDYRPGYVIKANGDSISGLVAYRGKKLNFKTCVFKETKKSKKIKYKPSELNAYGVTDDKRFESRRVSVDSSHKELRFIEIIVKGPVSLFSYKNTYMVEKDSLIELTRNKGTTYESEKGPYRKEDNRYIGVLNYVFTGCKIETSDLRYQEKHLVEVVHQYNECQGNPGVNFKRKKPWAKINYRLFFAEDISKLQAEEYNNNTFETSYAPTGGIGFDFTFPRSTDKVSFVIEAWYVKKLYQGYSESSTTSTTTRNDIFVRTSSYKFPVGLKYNFQMDGQTPYVKFGFVQYLLTNSTTETIKETEAGGTVFTNSGVKNLNKVLPQGFWIGAGYVKNLSNNFGVFGEIRFERNNGNFGTEVQSESSLLSLDFLVGIRF